MAQPSRHLTTTALRVEDALPDPLISGEQTLACEVLRLAVLDATGRAPDQGNNPGKYAFNVRQARLFCLAHGGVWARSREQWCDRAGVDPEFFTDCIERMVGATH